MPIFHAIPVASNMATSDEKVTYYHQLSIDFSWIYRFITNTDSFIVNGADLEYRPTNKITFIISWWMMVL